MILDVVFRFFLSLFLSSLFNLVLEIFETQTEYTARVGGMIGGGLGNRLLLKSLNNELLNLKLTL